MGGWSRAAWVTCASAVALGLAVPSAADPAPSFAVTSVAATPKLDLSAVRVSLKIKNTGAVDAPAFSYRLYLSADSTLDAGDAVLETDSWPGLAAGNTFSASATPALPAGLAGGAYCVIVQVPAGAPGTGAVGSSCFTVASQANLVLQAFSGPSSSPPGGGGAPFSVTVGNTGTAAAPASTLGVYLSSDGTLSSDDRLLASLQVGPLAIGASTTLTPTISIPALAPAHYTLFAVADDGNQVAESNESDNVASAPLDVLAPNLVPRIVSAPTSVSGSAGVVHIGFTIANVGTTQAPSSHYAVYLSSDSTLSADDRKIDEQPLGPINPGQSSSSVTADVPLPAQVLAGQWCALVQANSQPSEVAESSTADDVASACFTVQTALDLQPTALTAPATASFVGGPLATSVTVANNGNAPTPAARLALYLSRDGVVDASDAVVADVPLDPIPAFSSVTIPVTAVLPQSAPGAYRLLAVADSTNVVPEYDETNNLASTALTLVAPNLTPTVTQQARDTPAGGTVSLAFTAANTGTDGAAATDWALYLSGDAQLDGGDVRLGGGSLPALAAGATSAAIPASAQLPTGSPPGPHCLLVVLDASGSVAESNEGDNVAASCFTETDGTPPASTAAVSPPAPASGWYTAPVSVDVTATDAGGVAAVHYVVDGVETVVAGAAAHFTVAADGSHHVSYWAVDVAGNVEQSHALTIGIDTTLPVLQCAPPPVGWQGANVTLACTAADATSGLASQADASFALSTSVPAGAEDAAAQTGARQVCDLAGNCAVIGPFTAQVDRKAPTVVCTPPDAQPWHAADVTFTCTVADGGSGSSETSFALSTDVTPGTETASAQTGTHTSCDAVGNCVVTGPLTAAVDEKPPTVDCPAAGDAWHAADVAYTCTVADGGSGVDSASVTLTAQAPPGVETTVSTGSARVCDRVGNCTTAGPIDGVRIDTKPPTFSCQQPDALWHRGTVSLTCAGEDGGSGLAGSGTVTLSASAPGAETASAFTQSGQLCDRAGNCATLPALGPIKLDNLPPAVTCPAADGAWHGANVGFACTAVDGGSGPASSTFTLSTSVPAGTETASASTNAQQACDLVDNCAPVGPIAGVMVDRKPPTVTIAAPAGTYVVGAAVTAAYTCADGGSGVAGCTGTLANGAAVDTQAPGAHSFAVAARDAVGNAASAASAYTVTYGVCASSDHPPGPVGGKTIRVWVVVCDASGRDVSEKDMRLTAVGVDGGAVPALPGDRRFHYEPKFGFRYDLDGSRLAAGTHVLDFTIAGDPVVHTVPFTVPKRR